MARDGRSDCRANERANRDEHANRVSRKLEPVR